MSISETKEKSFNELKTNQYNNTLDFIKDATAKTIISPFVLIYLTAQGAKYTALKVPEYTVSAIEKVISAAKWATESVLIPLYNKLENSLIYIAEKVADAAAWTYNNVLTPAYHLLEDGAILLKDGIVYTAEKVADAAAWTYSNVLTPAYQILEDGAILLKDGIVYTAEKVADAAAWTYSNVLTPAYQILENGAAILNDNFWYLSNKIGTALSWTYNDVVIPTSKVMQDKAEQTAEYINSAKDSLIETSINMAHSVEESFYKSYDDASAMLCGSIGVFCSNENTD